MYVYKSVVEKRNASSSGAVGTVEKENISIVILKKMNLQRKVSGKYIVFIANDL